MKNDKKLIKESKIYNAAFELFSQKGINKTAIDDIVNKAGVAKGTFYLYFKDKYDIFDKIIIRKSSDILEQALESSKEMEFNDFIQEIIYISDYIIEYFKNNKLLLKLMGKNVSFVLFRKAIENDDSPIIKNAVKYFKEKAKDNNLDIDDTAKTLFIIIELVGSVAYSSIILKEPDDIDHMKPILFKNIRKILE